MIIEELQDLVLSGVQWELSEKNDDFSMLNVVPVKKENELRTATVVVPPISPIVSVSVDTVESMVARPVTIDALLRMIAEFNHPLRSGATNTILPNIATAPNGVLILTDMPSMEDDENGCLLTGAAGELLDKMLLAIGMTRSNVSICPLLFWRTPGGRTPSSQELKLARPFINRLIELLEPKLILTIGTLAATEFVGKDLRKNHGIFCKNEKDIDIVSIYHPNYLLLKPALKRDVWNVLQEVQKKLKNV